MLIFMLFLAGISVGLPSSNSEAVSEAVGIAADEACPNSAAAAARPASYLSASCTLCAYNIFEGGARGAQGESLRESTQALSRWLRDNVFKSPGDCHGVAAQGAVAALTECNGWDQAFLDRFASDSGASESILLKCPTGYHMTVMSTHPIRVVSTTTASPFHHGLLHVAIDFSSISAATGSLGQGDKDLEDREDGVRRRKARGGGDDASEKSIHFLLTHLSPRDSRIRAHECTLLADKCMSLTERGAAVVLLGDLNTLSPLDHSAYMRMGLEQVLRKDPRLNRKFLRSSTPPGCASSLMSSSSSSHSLDSLAESTSLDYRPMQILLDAGMHDLAKLAGTAGLKRLVDYPRLNGINTEETPLEATVPTNIKDDTMHAAAMRLDYILGNDRILPLSPLPAQVARDDTTLGLSDHLPLLHHLVFQPEF